MKRRTARLGTPQLKGDTIGLKSFHSSEVTRTRRDRLLEMGTKKGGMGIIRAKSSKLQKEKKAGTLTFQKSGMSYAVGKASQKK